MRHRRSKRGLIVVGLPQDSDCRSDCNWDFVVSEERGRRRKRLGGALNGVYGLYQ